MELVAALQRRGAITCHYSCLPESWTSLVMLHFKHPSLRLAEVQETFFNALGKGNGCKSRVA